MKKVNYEFFHDNTLKPESWFSQRVSHRKEITEDTPLHFHRSLELHYVVNGREQVKVGDKIFFAEKDDIVFIHNYTVHVDVPVLGHEKYVLVMPFTYGSDFNNLLKSKTLNPLLDDKEYNLTLKPIFKSLAEQTDMSMLILKGWLNVLFGSLFEKYSLIPFKKDASITVFSDILSFIDEKYNSDITLQTLADEFGYNKCYFSRLFNKYIGAGLPDYVNSVRLRNFIAKQKDGSKNIAETAFDCGFESLSTFYRCFNEVYGVSPKEYFSDKEVK